MAKSVTIKDIARRAGVSPSTVSNVLNGRFDRVSEETARRVRQVVEEMGYRPNPMARGLAGKRTDTLGVVVSSIVPHVFAHAVAGAQGVAERFGYNIVLCDNRNKEEREARSAAVLVDRSVDGIIFISSSSYRQTEAVEIVKAAGLPFVVVNRLTDPEAGLHILIENKQGTYQATQHLIELGHRAIGYIHLPVQGPKASLAAVERLDGFRQAMADYGLAVNPRWIRPGVAGEDNATPVGYAAMQEMLAEDGPTAVLCGSDYLAVGAMRAIADKGLKVPEDIAVVGHDDTPAAQYVTPPLTSVRQPMDRAGARAAEALILHLWRGTPLRGVERLPCELAVRASSSHVARI